MGVDKTVYAREIYAGTLKAFGVTSFRLTPATYASSGDITGFDGVLTVGGVLYTNDTPWHTQRCCRRPRAVTQTRTGEFDAPGIRLSPELEPAPPGAGCGGAAGGRRPRQAGAWGRAPRRSSRAAAPQRWAASPGGPRVGGGGERRGGGRRRGCRGRGVHLSSGEGRRGERDVGRWDAAGCTGCCMDERDGTRSRRVRAVGVGEGEAGGQHERALERSGRLQRRRGGARGGAEAGRGLSGGACAANRGRGGCCALRGACATNGAMGPGGALASATGCGSKRRCVSGCGSPRPPPRTRRRRRRPHPPPRAVALPRGGGGRKRAAAAQLRGCGVAGAPCSEGRRRRRAARGRRGHRRGRPRHTCAAGSQVVCSRRPRRGGSAQSEHVACSGPAAASPASLSGCSCVARFTAGLSPAPPPFLPQAWRVLRGARAPRRRRRSHARRR